MSDDILEFLYGQYSIGKLGIDTLVFFRKANFSVGKCNVTCLGIDVATSRSGNGKFHQNLYALAFERIETIRFHHDYFTSVTSTTFKYNRTYTAVNFTLDLLKDTPGNGQMVVEVQAYKMASNEYRIFPLRFMFDFCGTLKNNDFGLSRLTQCGNFTNCPFKKGVISVCKFAPDEKRFPPLIPRGSYKLDMKIFVGQDEILFFYGFGTIKYPSCEGCPLA